MELVAIAVMVVMGVGLAGFVIGAMSLARREREHAPGGEVQAPHRDGVAASLLFHVVTAGGATQDEALRQIRRGVGLAAPVTPGIDVANWAETYARHSSPEQRRELLEMAVQLVATQSPVPVRQYAALLDLSFGLGFQTDALARLRELYGFEYVDHAKDARPRSADRKGGGAPLYVRNARPRVELLRTLGIDGAVTRQELSAAYRRLVAQHHPDRFHGATAEAQSEAAARFIEITKAYEELLTTLAG
ncbi:MAG TPA: J domain-containing protein [Thermoanaerobaculia bacterium]|nr:J domain-containing protein [Thermoanaerobaculia bacterium]